MSSRKYYYNRRPIRDQHTWSVTHQRPRHASSETDMPDRRPQHASSETNMPDQRPIRDLNILHQRLTCLIGDPSKFSICYIEDLDMLQRRPTCLIRDPSEISTFFIRDQHAWSETHQRTRYATSKTNMPDWRPIKDLNMLHQRPICLIVDPL